MKHRLITFTLLAALTAALLACSHKPAENADVKIPGNILSEEAFARVLVDFALAESAANLNVKNVAIQRLDTTYAFDPLKDNHINKAKYDSTLAFYAAHTELYKKVYERVLAALTEMQAKRDSLAAHQPKLKKDSTAK